MNVEQLSHSNPYIAYCYRWHLTKAGETQISKEQMVWSRLSALTWFIFKEQAIIWSLVLSPGKFALKASIAGASGFLLGSVREIAFPGKVSIKDQWEQWLDIECALKTPVLLAYKGLSLNGTIFHVLLTFFLEKDLQYFNSFRVGMLAYDLGRYKCSQKNES